MQTVAVQQRQLELFPGTREASLFHQGRRGFFALNWRNAETKKEANKVSLLLADLEDYRTGAFRDTHAQAAGAASVDDRIATIEQQIAGKSRWPVRQQCFQLDALPTVIDALVNRQHFDTTDFWISQNGFGKPNRRATNIASLNMLFIDLDIRKQGHWLASHKPEESAWLIVQWCIDRDIPIPSFIVWSGNGLHLKWLFDSALPRSAKPVWDALQLHLVRHFKEGGMPVDEGARDASRILRIPGTYNQSGGELCHVVWVNGRDLESCARHDFNQLADGKQIMPWSREEARERRELGKIWDESRKISRSIDRLINNPERTVTDYLVADLWHKRLSAIRQLAEIRYGGAGVPEGERNTFTWIAANALAQSCGGADNYFLDLCPVISEFIPSFEHHEILSSASSISRRIKEPQGQDSGLLKMKNSTFREKLAITDDEAAILFGQSGRTRENINHGAMGFEKIRNLPRDQYDAEVHGRRLLSAERTNAVRKTVGRKSKRDELMPIVLDMVGQGKTQDQIAEALCNAGHETTRRTVSNWLTKHAATAPQKAPEIA